MKRLSALVFACGAGSCTLVSNASAATHLSPAAAKAQAAAKAAAYRKHLLDLAPADQYFGPLQQSMIGIRNTIRDLGLRYDVNHDIPNQTYASAQLTERAIRDWEHKYPRDTSIPSVVFRLQRLYTKILTQQSRDHAQAIATWMYHDFSSSPAAKQLRKTLAVEHLSPLPTPTPMPTPTDSPTPFPLPTLNPLLPPVPGASVAPTASPLPSGQVIPVPLRSGVPVPLPSVTPSAGAGATPMASATPSSATPLPSATAAPSPSASAMPAPSATASAAPGPH